MSVLDLGNADLDEMIREELAPLWNRLVIPVEERHVGDLSTEGSVKSRFELRRAIDELLVTSRR